MPIALNELLRATSRSFYLTLRVLPAAVRPQIGLAYLLARTTDTIADTEILPVEQRLEALGKLRGRILGQSTAPLNFGELAKQQGSPAERVLLEKAEVGLTLLGTFDPADIERIVAVVNTIIGGQELDLTRFERASESHIATLQTEAELDDYTYRVAGCVGEFWTKMCRAHLFPNARLDDAQLLADGIRFGKGLQLVNILRDLPADLRKGRCYLPFMQLERGDIKPVELLSPANEQKLRPVYNAWLDIAQAHLEAGWGYTNALPFGQIRVRLACAWPVLIGLETLRRLRSETILDGTRRVKVSRAEVRGIMWRTVLFYPMRGKWRSLGNQSKPS